MLQLLVRRARRHQQAPPIARRQPADDARAADGAVADGNHVLQLGFEDRVEVLRGAEGDERVGVCEGGEDADSIGGERVG